MMQLPPISNRTLITNQVTPEVCTSNLVAIDDTNYQTIVDWFRECLRLATELDESQRDDYELGVISNVKNSLSEFFQRTELSLGTLIGLDREISSLFENVGSFSVEKEQRGKSKSCCDEQEHLPTCCELEDALNKLYRNFMFVVIASFILLLLFIVVLSTLCWLRKCVAREIKERVDKLKVPAPIATEEEEEEEEPEEEEEEEEEMGEFGDDYDEYYPARIMRRMPMRRRRVIKKRVKFKRKSRPVVGILKRSAR